MDAMMKKFGYKNMMEVPKIDKIVLNMGVGEAKDNAKLLENAMSDMETIAGQKAVVTKAKNSIANFKIREGMSIGCKVTLRGEKMYEFLDRLVNLALPKYKRYLYLVFAGCFFLWLAFRLYSEWDALKIMPYIPYFL